MNSFEYSRDKINKLIDQCGLPKVCMGGVFGDLKHLKAVIEEVYEKHIFYLSYWKSECAWHGWSWANDDGTMEKQASITDGITDKFIEIYALILSGLGERMSEDDDSSKT